MTSNIEHLFMCIIFHVYTFSDVFSHILYVYIALFTYWIWKFFYVLDTSPSSHTIYIFLKSVVFFLCVLDHAFGIISKKSS